MIYWHIEGNSFLCHLGFFFFWFFKFYVLLCTLHTWGEPSSHLRWTSVWAFSASPSFIFWIGTYWRNIALYLPYIQRYENYFSWFHGLKFDIFISNIAMHKSKSEMILPIYIDIGWYLKLCLILWIKSDELT